jgi:hypothetical protein
MKNTSPAALPASDAGLDRLALRLGGDRAHIRRLRSYRVSDRDRVVGAAVDAGHQDRHGVHAGASRTLSLAALDIVRIPSAIVEPSIAASIVYVAAENFLSRDIEKRWRITRGARRVRDGRPPQKQAVDFGLRPFTVTSLWVP